MKIDDTNDPAGAPAGFRGLITVQATKHGLVLRSWPKKRGKAKSGYDLYRQLEFAAVQRLVKLADGLAVQTAMHWAKGTSQVPRDVLNMATYGTWFSFTDTDGNLWESARLSQPNAQYILDGVTDEPGSMIYRSELGWVGVPPGQPGQVLRYGPEGTPYWSDASDEAPGQWVVLRDWLWSVEGNTTFVSTADFANIGEVMLAVSGVTKSATGVFRVNVTGPGGSPSMFAGDAFDELSTAGVVTSTSTPVINTSNATAARSALAFIHGINIPNALKTATFPTKQTSGIIRSNMVGARAGIGVTGGGSMTGGRITIWGR